MLARYDNVEPLLCAVVRADLNGVAAWGKCADSHSWAKLDTGPFGEKSHTNYSNLAIDRHAHRIMAA
jgi:hypothetical protein